MAGGPFTNRDQWNHPGLADGVECSFTLRCIRYNKNIILAILGLPTDTGGVAGIDGSPRVFKNGYWWLMDQYNLYHKEGGYFIDGQMQQSLESTGYTYATIP
jgi:hypothetical protein